jgi:hypothetical protein
MRWGQTKMCVNSGHFCHKKLSCSIAMSPLSGGGKEERFLEGVCHVRIPQSVQIGCTIVRQCPVKNQSDSARGRRVKVSGNHPWHHEMTDDDR